MEEEPDEDRLNGVTRRLVFLQNQNFVQTEIKMIEKIEKNDSSKNSKSSSSKGPQKGKDKKGKCKDKGKDKDKDRNRDGDVVMDFDYSYLDDHHKAVLSSLVLTPDIISGGSRVQHSSSSHSTPLLTSPKRITRVPIGLIIGLGGGAMPMCMQRYLPGMRLYTCEMDGDMHAIAVKFFAFRSNSSDSYALSLSLTCLVLFFYQFYQNEFHFVASLRRRKERRCTFLI